MLDYEDRARQDGYRLIIGVDEAGRGPLAGPVVASAVALKKRTFREHIDDSKKISAQKREKAFVEILDNAYVGIGVISETVIDEVNILEATFLAMNRAVDDLITRVPPSQKKKNFSKKVCLFVDGHLFKSELPYTYQTVSGGDRLVFSVACASIVAKVTRDRILNIYDRIFPEYGFGQHKGYATAGHKQALRQFGPSVIHRKTFRY